MSDELQREADRLQALRRRTPARVLRARFGGSYSTADFLELRLAHAAAKDAVLADFLSDSFLHGDVFISTTCARDRQEYLLRPDLGRRLSPESRSEISQRCRRGADLQIAIGDGLSATAVAAQVPQLLPLLIDGARARGWLVGELFAVKHCRVGVMNDIGELLSPVVVVLLIGERPGLATAESLSAYMAYRPRPGHTDADRNLVSNIHSAGVPVADAAARILNLATQMRARELSGSNLKEELPGPRHRIPT